MILCQSFQSHAIYVQFSNIFHILLISSKNRRFSCVSIVKILNDKSSRFELNAKFHAETELIDGV